MSKKNTTTKANLKKSKAKSAPKKKVNIKNLESSLNEKITELESRIERQKDKNVRLLAEFDNYKRRTRDEKKHLPIQL